MSKKKLKREQAGRRRVYVGVTGQTTHHFIVCTPDLVAAMKDDGGRTLVYTKKEQAEVDAGARDFGAEYGGVFVVVGMGDAKWALFQKEEPHAVVPEA